MVISKGPLSCLLNILLFYHFEVIWTSSLLPYKAKVISQSHTKSQLHVPIHFRLFGILQFAQLKASSAITQELEFYQVWNLGMEVKSHNKSPFRQLLGKSNEKKSKKIIQNMMKFLWKKSEKTNHQLLKKMLNLTTQRLRHK